MGKQEASSENTIILFVCPPICCISIVCSFSWDLKWSQEKTKTMLMQYFGGQTKSIMVFSELADSTKYSSPVSSLKSALLLRLQYVNNASKKQDVSLHNIVCVYMSLYKKKPAD